MGVSVLLAFPPGMAVSYLQIPAAVSLPPTLSARQAQERNRRPTAVRRQELRGFEAWRMDCSYRWGARWKDIKESLATLELWKGASKSVVGGGGGMKTRSCSEENTCPTQNPTTDTIHKIESTHGTGIAIYFRFMAWLFFVNFCTACLWVGNPPPPLPSSSSSDWLYPERT